MMTKENTMRTFIVAMLCLAAAALVAPAAQADFGLGSFDTSIQRNGQLSRQAGAHADFITKLRFSGDEAIRDVKVDLPAGMIGNPNSVDKCTITELIGAGDNAPLCPATAQIGVAGIYNTPGAAPEKVKVYNLVAPSNLPALLGFNYEGVLARIEPRLRSSDYSITTSVRDIAQTHKISGVDLTIWGVPADASHARMGYGCDLVIYSCDPDVLAANGVPPVPDPAPRLPYLTNPTSCPSTPAAIPASVDSWQSTGQFSTLSPTADENGNPYLWDGCERLAFNPSIEVQPSSHTADAPSGVTVDLTVPQSDDPDGLATAHVRKTVVRFPEGMTVSPSSAAGLGACSLSEIALGTDREPTCPDSSKLGTVSIDTPLLAEPLQGDIILAKQNDNPFRSLLALYFVVRGPGVLIKLPGKVDLDQRTGQLTTTFDNTPQLPFSRLHVAFRGGPTAPLATPTACGTYSIHADVTSWASSTPVGLDTPMKIDQGCGRRDFNPSMSAGATNPVAGADTAFRFSVSRPDRSANLASIDAVLPPGLLARIADVPRCDDAQANAGTCPVESDIGSTSVLSGPGDAPLGLTGRVSLTGPYKGAPFGLSIVVQTRGQAGPFDLGAVVVRASIFVDRTDAHATVKSDPLPTIIQGIPLRLRQVVVNIDRPGFLFNPTSCAVKTVFAGLGSTDGNTLTRQARFQVAGCSALPVNQKLSLSLTGKSSTTDGTHPGIRAHLTSAKGSANLKKVTVALPLSLALDPDNAQALCKPEQRLALACPVKSIVGTATAKSILPHALTGPVYFVEGLRKSASGRTIRTLPKLWIPLSADGVTIDVNADSEVRQDRLVTTFDNIPDAPIQTFDLAINGGKHGIIVVSGKPSTCNRSRILDGELTGQNGTTTRIAPRMSVQGCKPTVKSKKSTSKSLTVRVANLGAGRLTVGGAGLVKATRTLKGATEASVTLRWTSSARRALLRHKRLKLKLTTTFVPKKGATLRSTQNVTARL
jgi:hypothetical protein